MEKFHTVVLRDLKGNEIKIPEKYQTLEEFLKVEKGSINFLTKDQNYIFIYHGESWMLTNPLSDILEDVIYCLPQKKKAKSCIQLENPNTNNVNDAQHHSNLQNLELNLTDVEELAFQFAPRRSLSDVKFVLLNTKNDIKKATRILKSGVDLLDYFETFQKFDPGPFYQSDFQNEFCSPYETKISPLSIHNDWLYFASSFYDLDNINTNHMIFTDGNEEIDNALSIFPE